MAKPEKSDHAIGMDAITELLDKISPMLTGVRTDVLAVVLADLVATFIAGHISAGGPKLTMEAHGQLLRKHVAAVLQLIPINHAKLLMRMADGENSKPH